jgi:hypothetical protein
MIDRLGIGISGCRHYGLRPKALRLRGLAAQAAGATRLGRGVAVALRLDWRVVELQLVHAQFLGRAQCEAGLFHQRALVGDMHRVRRDADAGCDAELALPLQQHRRTDGVEQLARDRFGLLRGRQLVCQHGESRRATTSLARSCFFTRAASSRSASPTSRPRLSFMRWKRSTLSSRIAKQRS